MDKGREWTTGLIQLLVFFHVDGLGSRASAGGDDARGEGRRDGERPAEDSKGLARGLAAAGYLAPCTGTAAVCRRTRLGLYGGLCVWLRVLEPARNAPRHNAHSGPRLARPAAPRTRRFVCVAAAEASLRVPPGRRANAQGRRPSGEQQQGPSADAPGRFRAALQGRQAGRAGRQAGRHAGSVNKSSARGTWPPALAPLCAKVPAGFKNAWPARRPLPPAAAARGTATSLALALQHASRQRSIRRLPAASITHCAVGGPPPPPASVQRPAHPPAAPSP